MAFNNPYSQLGEVQIQDQSGVVINPATEEKQDAIISALGGSIQATSVGTFITTVTTAGTPVQLPNHACKKCRVQKIPSDINTKGGYVVVGDSSVDCATGQGNLLYDTQSEDYSVSNTNLLYVDASISGAQISVYYEN